MRTFIKTLAGGLACAAGAQVITLPPVAAVVLGMAYMIAVSLVINTLGHRR